MKTAVVHTFAISKNYWFYLVVVGQNPFGKKGGTCGNWVDGEAVGPRFKRRAEAEKYAEKINADLRAAGGALC